MIDKPGHCNALHPCADKRYALPAEEKTVVPVFQRTEYCLKSVGTIYVSRHFGFSVQKIPKTARTRMIIIVMPDTPMGNHTGATQGFGMRKRTSMVVREGGHLIKMKSDK